MADSNSLIENSQSDITITNEKHKNLTRAALPRNPPLLRSIADKNTSSTPNNPESRPRRRSSRASLPHPFIDRRFIRYENTFRMEPSEQEKIDIARVHRIATNVIDTAVSGYTYEGTQAKQFTGMLADRIRAQIKQLAYQRYKIVLVVCIGQNLRQDLRIVSRGIWDAKWDRHLTITKETANAFVSVTIFCVYAE